MNKIISRYELSEPLSLSLVLQSANANSSQEQVQYDSRHPDVPDISKHLMCVTNVCFLLLSLHYNVGRCYWQRRHVDEVALCHNVPQLLCKLADEDVNLLQIPFTHGGVTDHHECVTFVSEVLIGMCASI